MPVPWQVRLVAASAGVAAVTPNIPAAASGIAISAERKLIGYSLLVVVVLVRSYNYAGVSVNRKSDSL